MKRATGVFLPGYHFLAVIRYPILEYLMDVHTGIATIHIITQHIECPYYHHAMEGLHYRIKLFFGIGLPAMSVFQIQ